MDSCTYSNQLKHVKIGFFPSWRRLCCMMAFAGAFTTKQQLMHPHCFVYNDKTWMNTVLTLACFTKMIAEQPSLTQYELPMYHIYERKIAMLSSTDTNFMICRFDFERFSISSRFKKKLTLYMKGFSYLVESTCHTSLPLTWKIHASFKWIHLCDSYPTFLF